MSTERKTDGDAADYERRAAFLQQRLLPMAREAAAGADPSLQECVDVYERYVEVYRDLAEMRRRSEREDQLSRQMYGENAVRRPLDAKAMSQDMRWLEWQVTDAIQTGDSVAMRQLLEQLLEQVLETDGGSRHDRDVRQDLIIRLNLALGENEKTAPGAHGAYR